MDAGIEVREASLCEVVAGLKFPEGPLALPEGGLLFVECWRGTLSRFTAAGEYENVAELGHRPASVARGPDGRYYVCNDGGLNEGETAAAVASGEDLYGDARIEPGGGCIQVVDFEPDDPTSVASFETLYDASEGWPIGAANDLVFDEWGGFYFTDFVKRNQRMATRGRVCYALPDGSFIKDVVAPIDTPNGVGLSPDGKSLYVAQADHARLWAFDVEGPGEVRTTRGMDRGGRLLCTLPGVCGFDSLGVDGEGYICVATTGTGRMTIVAPDGSRVSQLELGDPHVTNICWGGPEHRTAYITLGGAGKIVSLDWERPGLPLHFLDRQAVASA
jgi:gluconolactonase